jgi:hypothetical protein
MRDELSSAVRWAWFLARFYAARLWRDLPGPWPVKVVLIVACVAIPGPFDPFMWHVHTAIGVLMVVYAEHVLAKQCRRG